MKRILLLTDFSDNSINAMHYAMQFLKEEICTFFILHTKSSSSYISGDLIMSGSNSIYQSIIKNEKDQLKDLIVDLVKVFDNDNFQYEPIVEYGDLTNAVNELVISKQIDFIFMGTKGNTGVKEKVFGSNTIHVIRNVDCATFVVPDGFLYKKPEEIIFPLDPFDAMNGVAFSKAIRVIKSFSKKIHVLRINENSVDEERKHSDQETLKTVLHKVPFVYYAVHDLPKHHAVNGYVQTNNIDLIVLIKHKELMFEHFFMGSSTTKIGSHLEVPLLVVHDELD
ncbi:universal stress protein [Sediminibacter sp. Hel_I_10]|uniref:universal stress protein n=1 Tax=Sediminibacter sp. Hel_I_10 TaxID=1392490 RepID=UPI000563ED80|nr:universal stress protein [Sediminibacter sp. Hel_I_10]